MKLILCLIAVLTMFYSPPITYAATPYSYCFIGDSRFVGMEQYVETDEDITWITEIGAGQELYWENREYIASLDRDTIIIYELGVNNLDDTNGCINALRDLEALGFNHIYFTSITPVNEDLCFIYGYIETNECIEKFNNVVRSNLPYSAATMYCYEYLNNIGIDTEDGLHYEVETYYEWFYNILNSL